jgi:hypothetical protein
MARKLNELKFQQEMEGRVEVNNRRLTPQFVPCFVPFQPQPGIYPQKRRLEIAIEVKPDVEAPRPVKIIHTVLN